MQRRSFVKRLFGAVLAGFAAPRVGAWAAESVVVIEPPGLYVPMVGGQYRADQPMFPVQLPMTYRGKQIGEIPVWIHDR